MGDRSNIVIVNGGHSKNEETSQWERDATKDSRVWLYGHWMGESAIAHARHGLASGRRNDGPYLARIIFASMIKDELHEETGYGIATAPQDNEHPIIVIDPESADGPVVWLEAAGAESDGSRKILAEPISADQFVGLTADNFTELERQMKAARS